LDTKKSGQSGKEKTVLRRIPGMAPVPLLVCAVSFPRFMTGVVRGSGNERGRD
jgi:hypothetical protein